MIHRQVCAFHADEDVVGTLIDKVGTYSFVCERTSGHPGVGPHRWMSVPEPPQAPGLSGLAEELRLDVELPAAIAKHPGRWIEYGVEATYADARRDDFGSLVQRYGHTAIQATQYSASAFLASTLGHQPTRSRPVPPRRCNRPGWDYNGQISWWSLAPEPDWPHRVSWEGLKRSMRYVPGRTEVCPIGLCRATADKPCTHKDPSRQ